MTVEAVCFDLDGTLLYEAVGEAVLRASKAVAAMCDGVEAAQLASIHRDVFTAGWSETERDFVYGTRTGDEISREIWRRALSAVGLDDWTLVETAFKVPTRELTAAYCLYDDTLAVRTFSDHECRWR